jgi:hypothetical protein
MKKLLLASLLCLFSSLSFAVSEDVGKVILSFGKNVAISADGTERVLKRKSEIYAEDILYTGSKGRLQVRFTDGSRLSLKPGSEFKIEQYNFDQAKPDEGKAFYKLIKGGMRTISGNIGKKDQEAYKLDAVVATIGIRGTDFSVDKLGDKISGSVNSGKINVAAKAGGNKDISSGRSFSLTGAQGTIVEFKTPPEQQSEGSATESEDSSEESSEEKDETQSSEESEEGAESEEQSSEQQTPESESGSGEESTETTTSNESSDSQSTGSSDSSGSQTSSDTNSTIDSSVSVVTSTDSSGSNLPATDPTAEGTQDLVLSSPDPTGNGVAAPVGGTALISFIDKEADGTLKTSTGTVTVDDVSALTIDETTGKDLLTGIQYVDTDPQNGSDVCAPCTFESPSSVSAVRDDGTETIGGAQVSWGRWGSGFEIIDSDGVVNVKGSFHFIYADQLTSSTELAAVAAIRSGQYIYGLSDSAHATSMEIETGDLGTLTLYNNNASAPDGTYMIINWDNQSIDTFSLEGQVQDPVYSNTRFYTLTKKDATSLSLNTVLNGGDLEIQGTCTGSLTNCETIVNISGRASIELVGKNAEGAVTTYAAQGGPSAAGDKISISGAALLEDQGAVP